MRDDKQLLACLRFTGEILGSGDIAGMFGDGNHSVSIDFGFYILSGLSSILGKFSESFIFPFLVGVEGEDECTRGKLDGGRPFDEIWDSSA